MKRIGGLYEQICSIKNLILAERKARRGKSKQRGVIKFDEDPIGKLLHLRDVLVAKKFRTSKYYIFRLFEGKERIIYRLPYYMDRIVHHALMNILEPIFVSTFISTTFNCIRGRGIMGLYRAVTKALLDVDNTVYCLKLDIKKFYPNIDNSILKFLLRKKFKDQDLLTMLDEIIDSTQGIPLGNYLSQFLANFYLTYFDHWLKETLLVKYYFRYCDDIIIFHKDKEYLHELLKSIQKYLDTNLKLKVKSNYQVFPIEARGVDIVGYKFYHEYVLLRKSIKKRFIRMMLLYRNRGSIVSYNGWLKYCCSKNLKLKYK